MKVAVKNNVLVKKVPRAPREEPRAPKILRPEPAKVWRGGVPKVGTNDAARVRGGWGVRTWRRQTPQGMRGFQVFFTKELATYPPFSTYTKVQ